MKYVGFVLEIATAVSKANAVESEQRADGRKQRYIMLEASRC